MDHFLDVVHSTADRDYLSWLLGELLDELRFSREGFAVLDEDRPRLHIVAPQRSVVLSLASVEAANRDGRNHFRFFDLDPYGDAVVITHQPGSGFVLSWYDTHVDLAPLPMPDPMDETVHRAVPLHVATRLHALAELDCHATPARATGWPGVLLDLQCGPGEPSAA